MEQGQNRFSAHDGLIEHLIAGLVVDHGTADLSHCPLDP